VAVDTQRDGLVAPSLQQPEPSNIAAFLPLRASQAPDQPAVVVARAGAYHSLTFAGLEALTNRYANGLVNNGIERGTRTLVMVRAGSEFVGVIFSLLKIGAVPVLIDPGMGVGRMLACIQAVEPEALIGVPLAQAVRRFRPGAFRSVRYVVTVGRRWFWGGPTLQALSERSNDRFEPADTAPDETAAILFTSGATGPAKGVVYEHGMFCTQVRWIQSYYGLEPGEVDLSCFPLFALFCPAMGLTSVLPEMDPSRPARADPAKLVRAINDQRATTTFGSPAVWNRVSAYCLERGIELPTLRRVLMAGAPVPWQLQDRMQRILAPSAEVHTPYGATEALPVSSITGREVLSDCARQSRCGAGICVGQPVPGITLRIIRITDEPIERWSDDLVVPEGELGEIVVSGPVVTKQYAGLPQATAATKIYDGDRLWHRMGDVGYLDRPGRLWYCGRKAHRVVTEQRTLFSIPCEAVFNEHEDVFRSALVGVGPTGRKRPVVVIEPEPGRFPSGARKARFTDELLELARGHELTRDIRDVLFHRGFPVDVRHNAKIDREQLARWAAGRLQ
jgi:acyl-CoA synthetase (AMP-forming)/AMP-acid ligase II